MVTDDDVISASVDQTVVVWSVELVNDCIQVTSIKAYGE